ncbi:MAG: branched-chain amino acid transporter permease [Hyphomicrobiales bacterium]|nr:branched-chain amino acid transporter permease [Hyphomicrobiales bacterium]
MSTPDKNRAPPLETDGMRLPRRKLLAPLLLLAALALVPTLAQTFDNPFLIRLFTRVIILAITAVALNFVLGFGGLVSLMHAGLFGIGAYTVAILSFHDFNAQPLLLGWTGTSNLAVSGPLAILAAAGAALLAGLVCLRTTGTYFIMITLAFNQMLYYFFVALQEYGGDDGLQILGTIDFAGFDVTRRVTFYYVCLGTLAVVIGLFTRIVGSRFGTILRATAQNERRTIALGIPPLRYKLAAFTLSGAVAGLAGALWATGQGFVSPADMAWTRSGDLVVMAVLGGMSSVWAPVIGAAAFLVLQSFLSGWTVFWQLPLGLLIIFTIVLLRGGLVDFAGRLRALLPGGRR